MTRAGIRHGKYSVWVYKGTAERHHLPHCHVLWTDGSTVVALPTLEVIAGDALPRQARELLVEHLDQIVEEWEKLNPERPEG